MATDKKAQKVVQDPAIPAKKKEKILDTLEQDARLLDTASDEGMTGGEPSNLHQVLDAKKKPERIGGNPPPGSDAEVAKEAEVEKLDP
jgi:hypothetical protein